MGSADSPWYRLNVVGGFTLHSPDGSVELRPSAMRLPTLLSLARRALSREHVTGMLWPDQPFDKSSASLRTLLWRLPQHQGRALVRSDGTNLALADDVELDAVQFERDLRATIRDPRTAPEISVDLLRADIVPEIWDDWLLFDREHFRQLRLHALDRLSEEAQYQRNLSLAFDYAMLAIDCDPLRESAHRRVIDLHLNEGNANEALRHYELYCRQAEHGIGLAPTGAMTRLVAPLLQSHQRELDVYLPAKALPPMGPTP